MDSPEGTGQEACGSCLGPCTIGCQLEKPAYKQPLAGKADGEAEDLFAVPECLDEREAEIEGKRYRAEERHRDAEAEARRHAIVIQLQPALDRTRIEEGHRLDLIVGGQRHRV